MFIVCFGAVLVGFVYCLCYQSTVASAAGRR